MLFSHSMPWRHTVRQYARCLASFTVVTFLAVWSAGVLAQNVPSAEDAIKKAIQNAQFDQALKLVQQERQNAPQEVQWQFMEGVIQAQQGQVDKAIDTFKKITQTHPEQSEAYNNLGVLFASKGQLEASKAFLEKALQTHPSYAAAHRNLSDVHSQLAKQSYAKALQVDPKVKVTAPQLTLLGSLGSDKRPPPKGVTVAANTPAAAPPAPMASSRALSQPPAVPASSTPAPKVAAPASAATPATLAEAKTAPKPAASQPTPTPNTVTPAVTAALPAVVAKTQDPAATPQQLDPIEIQNAVQAWAKAWSDKDMKRYYAAYASQFTPANGATRAQWESDRRIRIVSKKTIAVELRDMKVTAKGDTATVRFQQIYSSDNLKGTSRKTLDMVRQGQKWLIVRESVN
jgi:tetratricopeptide (TPR) repeat protein